MKQNGLCLDTLGKQVGGSPGLFKCHGSGGNQVGLEVSSIGNMILPQLMVAVDLKHNWRFASTLFQSCHFHPCPPDPSAILSSSPRHGP